MMIALPVPKSLSRAARLLGAMGGLALASTRELDPAPLIIFLSLFLVGIKLQVFPRTARLMGALTPFFAVGVFILSLFDFFVLSGSFLLSAAHFLLLIQGLRLLSLETARDSLGSILLSSMMMLSASTLAAEWTFFLMLFLFLPAMIWALILHNMVNENNRVYRENNESKQTESGDPLQDGFLREDSFHWKKTIRSIRLSSVAAFAVAVLCCFVVFIVFPRFNFQGFRGQFLQPVHKSGFTNEVRLSQNGRIFEDSAIVMRVEIPPDDRAHWTGYMRGAVLDEFDGKKWSASDKNWTRIFRTGDGYNLPIQERGEGAILRQSIYLESTDSPILFGAHRMTIIKSDRPHLLYQEDGSLKRPFGDSWRIHYDVVSKVIEPFKNLKKYKFNKTNQRPPRPDVLNKIAKLDQPHPRLAALAGTLTNNIPTPIGKAAKISQTLSEEYEYTLNSGIKGKDDPIEEFLFEKKKGHCEFFASAMTMMLRSIGIPARMVAGFYSPEWNERGEYAVIRMRHSHSWVEAYIEPYGWIEFDPSPVPQPGAVNNKSFFKRLSDIQDLINLSWNRYILSYDIERQVEIVQSINDRSHEVSSRMDRWVMGVKTTFDWYKNRIRGIKTDDLGVSKRNLFLYPFILIGGVLFFILLIKRWIQKRKTSPVWFYSNFLGLLEKQAGPKPAGFTLNEYITANAEKLGEKLAPAQFLSNAYYEQRFNSLNSSEALNRPLILQYLKILKS